PRPPRSSLFPYTTLFRSYLAAWKAAEIRVRAALTARLEALTEPFEGKVAYLLARHLPPATPLMMANSMTVRDLEYFWLPQERERDRKSTRLNSSHVKISY